MRERKEIGLIEFLVASLAVYRVSRMVAMEDGPFEAFLKLRNATLKLPASHPKDHWIARGIRCPLCISFWAGLVAALFISRDWKSYLLTAMGLSGAAVAIYKGVDDGR